MSLNLMSLIGVGRVGLGPNMDDVTNFTLFFFEGFPKLSYRTNGVMSNRVSHEITNHDGFENR